MIWIRCASYKFRLYIRWTRCQWCIFNYIYIYLTYKFFKSLLGKYDEIAIQCWHAMTACGVLRINTEIESIFNIQFKDAVVILEQTLESVFPGDRFCLINSEESWQLDGIVRSAHRLSSMLQTGFLSLRLIVTNVPVKDGSDVFFWYTCAGSW